MKASEFFSIIVRAPTATEASKIARALLPTLSAEEYIDIHEMYEELQIADIPVNPALICCDADIRYLDDSITIAELTMATTMWHACHIKESLELLRKIKEGVI